MNNNLIRLDKYNNRFINSTAIKAIKNKDKIELRRRYILNAR